MHTQKPVIFLAFTRAQSKRAHHLQNLSKELSSIRQALQKAINANLCEVVERVDACISEIINVFQEKNYKDRIAVFHYEGLANSYRLLLESYRIEIEPAHKDGPVPFPEGDVVYTGSSDKSIRLWKLKKHRT